MTTSWLRDPLLHFIVFGGLLFAIDHAMATRKDDPRVIVVGADVDREARSVFKAARGRDPDAKELAALRRVWLDNEVLYREGLALQVDRGDPTIRERVIFKALSIVDANVQLPPPDDATLRTWFDKHRADYDEPARFDFEEAMPVGTGPDQSIPAIVDALNSLHAAEGGETHANLRVYKARPEASLVQSYGPEFAVALKAALAASSPAGQWRVLPSRDGPRAIHPVAATSPKLADFDALRGVVRGDWATATASEQRSAAVHAMAGKYKVVLDTTAQPVVAAEDDDEAPAQPVGSSPAASTVAVAGAEPK